MSALTLRALEQQTEAEKQKINAISAQIVAEKARDEESFQREKAEQRSIYFFSIAERSRVEVLCLPNKPGKLQN